MLPPSLKCADRVMKQLTVSGLRRGVLQLIVYALGLFIMAVGVSFSVNSNLGVSPLNSIPYVLSQITGLALSLCVVIVCVAFILFQIILLGRRFRPVQLTQMFFSFLFGYFIDLANWITGGFTIPTYAGKLLMLAISVVLIAFGVTLYVEIKLIPMPLEGFPLALIQRFEQPFPKMKNLVDCTMVACAALMSLLFLHRLAGVREGTIIAALATGRLMGLIRKPLLKKLDRLLRCERPES